MTAIHQAATNALARVNPDSLPTVSRSGLPAWADAAILSGEPNAYFDAKEQARGLTSAQKQGLPSLIQAVEDKLQGPNAEARAHLAEALLAIALRVQPGITETVGLSWATNLLDSLSRTPTDLLAKAVEAARYRQFQFLNEVGPFLAAEIDEPLRQRNIKLNRLREIELAASALPANGAKVYCTQEEAQAIADEYRAKVAKRAPTPAERPEIDWDVEAVKRNADSNFLRAMHGLPPRTVDEWKRDQADSIRKLRGLPDDEGFDGLRAGEA